MINYKVCTENNNFSSDFSAKIEVETNSRKELETILKVLGVFGEDDTVCHCNVKENAELVAEILDCDANGEVAPRLAEKIRKHPLIWKLFFRIA